jgi:hypothetical protein
MISSVYEDADLTKTIILASDGSTLTQIIPQLSQNGIGVLLKFPLIKLSPPILTLPFFNYSIVIDQRLYGIPARVPAPLRDELSSIQPM